MNKSEVAGAVMDRRSVTETCLAAKGTQLHRSAMEVAWGDARPDSCGPTEEGLRTTFLDFLEWRKGREQALRRVLSAGCRLA